MRHSCRKTEEIANRDFKLLCDFMKIKEIMTEIYEHDRSNGVPAPFLEYALYGSRIDTSHTHKFRIWEEAGKIVAFVFYENPISNTYFSLRPDYEKLAEEMVAYAGVPLCRARKAGCGKNCRMLLEGL